MITRIRVSLSVIVALLLLAINVYAKPPEAAALQDTTPTVTPPIPAHLPVITAANAARLTYLIALPGPNDWIGGVAFSPDNQLLAASQFTGTIFLWDTKTWSIVAKFSAGSEESSNVQFSPDGKLFASTNGTDSNSILLWNVETALHSSNPTPSKILQNPDSSYAVSVVFQPDGKVVASLDYDGNIRLWDVASDNNIDWIQTGDNGLNQLLFSPDGKVLAYTTPSAIHLINMQTKAKTDIPASNPFVFAFSPDSSKLAFENSRTLVLWDIYTDRELFTLQPDDNFGPIGAITFSPNGKIVAASGNYNVILWGMDTRNKLRILDSGGVMTMMFSPDGTMFAVGHTGSGFSNWVDVWGIR